MKFDWKVYLHEQLQWAECLMSRAEDCEGQEKQALYELSKSALHNATQRLEAITE